jgi:hypothetical protein
MALPGGRTHKPKPFQRPGITLSEHGAKKRWVRAHPERLEIGDIIRGHGLIVGGEIKDRYDPRTRSRLSYVSFELKNGTGLSVDALDTVIAFTEAEGEPVG